MLEYGLGLRTLNEGRGQEAQRRFGSPHVGKKAFSSPHVGRKQKEKVNMQFQCGLAYEVNIVKPQ